MKKETTKKLKYENYDDRRVSKQFENNIIKFKKKRKKKE